MINAENFHALQVLLYTHEGNVDAIYIDPPYNTGARDWKYNNDSDDAYRHSKWLAMMERRMKLAKRLLNPEGSVLIVAVDEREVHRLALLLEQVFEDPEFLDGDERHQRQGGGSARKVLAGGRASVCGADRRRGRYALDEEHDRPHQGGQECPRRGLSGSAYGAGNPPVNAGRGANQFYPIVVDNRTNTIHSIGGAVADDVDRRSVASPEGTRAIWPLKPDGTEMLWGLTPDVFASKLEEWIRACQQEGDCPVSPNGNHSGDNGRNHRGYRTGQGRFRPRHQTSRRRDADAETRLERALS